MLPKPAKYRSVFFNPYQDWKALAIGVPFITICLTLIGTNNDLTDPEELQQLLVKLAYNCLATALCWVVIRQLIVVMDQRMPWEKGQEVSRLLLQLPLVSLGFSLVYLLITVLRTRLFDFWPIDWREIWLTDYPLALLFLLAINFGYYYHWQQRHGEIPSDTPPAKTKAPPKKITVVKGRARVILAPEQITCAYREHEVNYVMDGEEVSYLWDDSLSALEPLLPGFFRLNRQYLVSREAVSTYAVLPNRNLRVRLKGRKNNSVEVNKNRAAAFRRWLKPA